MAQLALVANGSRWSLITRAQGPGDGGRVALGELLNYYDSFVVWLIRQHRLPPDRTAEELKQEFLEGVLRRNDIAKLNRERGSFRAWLRKAVKRFLLNEWHKWRAARAGRRDTLPVDFEANDLSAPADDVCTREFASQILSRALAEQRQESSNVQRFDALALFLPGPQMAPVDQGSLCKRLGTTPNALASSICKLRTRFRQLLREAIGDSLGLERNIETHADPATREAGRRAIDDELRELRQYFWS